MRKAINENPLVQIGLLGVLALVVAVVFVMQMGGGEDEAAPAPAPAPSAATADPATADPATAPDASAPTAAEPVEPAVSGSGLQASKGLPGRFAQAYENGDPVAIFVVRDEPVSDKVVVRYAERLRSEGRVSVFVIEPDDLSDWVRVIGSVGIDRTPALVMVSPKEKNAQPVASVSYGFRNYESVRQAIADARYDGPVGGYDPD